MFSITLVCGAFENFSNYWGPIFKPPDSTNNPYKQVYLVGGSREWTLSPTDQTRPKNHCMESGRYQGIDSPNR